MSHGQGPSPLSATRPGDEVKLSLEEPLLHEKDSLTNPPPTNPSVGGTTTLYAGKISEGETEGYGTTRGWAPSRIGIGERKGIAAAKQEGKNVVAASKRGEAITYYDGKSHKYADHEAKRREWEETAHIYQAKEETKVRAWEGGDDFQLVPQEPHTQPKDPYQMPEPVVDPYASASKSDGTYMSVYEGQEYKPATYEVSEYTSVYDRKVVCQQVIRKSYILQFRCISNSCGDGVTIFPTLDVSPILAPGILWSDDVPDIVHTQRAKISEAMKKWGGFYVTGHGLERNELITNIRKEARNFFNMGTKDKEKLQITASNPLGWSRSEMTKGQRDWKEIYDVAKDDLQYSPRIAERHEYGMNGTCNQWPEYQKNFRDVVTAYFDVVTQLSQAVLDSLGCSLGEAGKKFIRESFKDTTSFLRFNFYPKWPLHDDGQLCVNRHTDAGAVTVLLMDDVASLQINRVSQNGKDNWVDVPPLPSKTTTVLMIMGDVMQAISNENFMALEHRVKTQPHSERYSMVYFLNPAYSVEVKPIQEREGVCSPPRYTPFMWGDFRRQRVLGDVGVEGRFGKEDVQLHHFKINV